MIDHVYVIGDRVREPERITYLDTYFKELGITVTYFQPTYMNTLSPEELARFSKETHGRLFKASEKSVFLNFFYLFEKCVKEHTGYVLIFESDVIFEGNLITYLEGLSKFISGELPEAISIGSGCDLIDDDVNTDDMNFQIARKQIVRCMDSILFSKKGLSMILDYIRPVDILNRQFC